MKTTNFFSVTLMKRSIRSNVLLTVVIVFIMIMMSTVVNYAISIMPAPKGGDTDTEAQEKFFSYLSVLSVSNKMSGSELSYSDFINSEDKTIYETVLSSAKQNPMLSDAEIDFTTEEFQAVIDTLSDGDISLETYVEQFEYAYALGNSSGVFSGDDLDMERMVTVTLETMGVDSETVEKMGEMDMTTMLNQMYFTVIGLLPILIYVVIVANGLIASQVDSGSLAYVLSTPIKRKAVTITQTVFMVIVPLVMLTLVCISRIVTTKIFYDEVNVPKIVMLYFGMYLLIQAIGSICFLGSCIFDLSRKSTAFGGGFTVWFFLASLLGMFGMDNMVDVGMGVESLGIFNKLTLIGLYDIQSISTVGTDNVDTAFVPKLCILAAAAVCCYTVGSVRFCKKDLPL